MNPLKEKRVSYEPIKSKTGVHLNPGISTTLGAFYIVASDQPAADKEVWGAEGWPVPEDAGARGPAPEDAGARRHLVQEMHRKSTPRSNRMHTRITSSH